jgi:ABC-type sugar transport system ATPase subunit
MSDRVLVMKNGRIIKELAKKDVSTTNIVFHALS